MSRLDPSAEPYRPVPRQQMMASLRPTCHIPINKVAGAKQRMLTRAEQTECPRIARAAPGYRRQLLVELVWRTQWNWLGR